MIEFLVRGSRKNAEFPSHHPSIGSLITSVLIQSAVCIAQKLSLSWIESSAQQSAVDMSVSGVFLRLSNPATKKPVKTKTKSQSLGLWRWELLRCFRFCRLSVCWSWFDSDIRAFPIWEGLQWELVNNPAVGFWRLVLVKYSRVLRVDFNACVSVFSNQYITVDLSASGGLAT